MKNTGIVHSSQECKPVILSELAQLLPPLGAEQLSSLEADILQNGCYSPVIVNEDLALVDGHNRQAICEKHGIPYQLAVFSFADLLEAKQWALDTQKSRRNLSNWDLGQIALKLKPEIEERAKANQGSRTDISATLPECSVPIDTRKELAESVGLGERTMGKVMQIEEHAPSAVKDALSKNELSINQGYNLVKQLEKLPQEQRDQAATDVLEYEKAKKELQGKDAELVRQSKISAQYSRAFEKALLLTPSEEAVRIWVQNTRMTAAELVDTVKEAKALSQIFSQIAEIIEHKLLPAEGRCMDVPEEVPQSSEAST